MLIIQQWYQLTWFGKAGHLLGGVPGLGVVRSPLPFVVYPPSPQSPKPLCSAAIPKHRLGASSVSLRNRVSSYLPQNSGQGQGPEWKRRLGVRQIQVYVLVPPLTSQGGRPSTSLSLSSFLCELGIGCPIGCEDWLKWLRGRHWIPAKLETGRDGHNNMPYYSLHGTTPLISTVPFICTTILLGWAIIPIS